MNDTLSTLFVKKAPIHCGMCNKQNRNKKAICVPNITKRKKKTCIEDRIFQNTLPFASHRVKSRG